MANSRQRANRRLASARAAATALPHDVERQPRVPLAGFEQLYEITQSGAVYSRREGRFIKHKFYENRAYIEFSVDGEKHQLRITEAVEQSWARAERRLFRVDVPATTLVVLAYDEREAVKAAASGLAEEVRDYRLRPKPEAVTSATEVPDGWSDGYPYGPEGVDTTGETVSEHLAARAKPRPA